MIKSRLAILLILIPALIMCSRRNEKTLTPDQIREAEEALVNANRGLLKRDKARIIEYIGNHDLALKETRSGLWFEIISQGKGAEVKEGMQISIEYQVSLLDGTICYRSDSLGNKVFRVGQGGIESGIDEGIRILSEGGEAIFILPPHLAHGLTGDGNCIPPRSVIVYHIKVVKADP